MRNYRALICAVISLVFTQAASAQKAEIDRPDRFAFLPYFFLDIGNGFEHDGTRGRPYPVQDCSSAGFNCLNGKIFRLTWPKNCLALDEGAVWKTAGVTTEVVASFIQPGHYEDYTYFLAKSANVDNSLYVIRKGSGLVGIVYDPLRRDVLTNPDQVLSVMVELKSGEKAKNDYAVARLVGLGNVGICNKL